jgi:hypothetical protein
MSTRTAPQSHLGERRFLEYPQFVSAEISRRVLTLPRLLIGLSVVGAALAGVLLLP